MKDILDPWFRSLHQEKKANRRERGWSNAASVCNQRSWKSSELRKSEGNREIGEEWRKERTTYDSATNRLSLEVRGGGRRVPLRRKMFEGWCEHARKSERQRKLAADTG